MIQCDHDKPRCKKKAVVLILLKGMKVPGAEEVALVACCAEHANDMLYANAKQLQREGITLEEMFINGWGLLTENYRVLFLTEEMHRQGQNNTAEGIMLAIEKGVHEHETE